jgi:hypothetical protein
MGAEIMSGIMYDHMPRSSAMRSSLRRYFFIRLRSFHHDNKTLTMKARMIRLNTASPTASV